MAVDARAGDDDEVSVSRLHPDRPHTAFVLGGGGNLGAIQVGMLRAMLERELRPDVLVGCSAGAINAAGLAANPTLDGVKELEDIWRGLSGDDLMPASRLSGLWLLTRKYRSLQPNDGMRRLIEKLPFRRFEEASVPLHVVATALRDGSERWFSTGSVVEPILASAALPAIFPPVEVAGELFIDGAVVNNVPISKAVEVGAQRIYVLHVGNFHRPRPVPRRPIDALLQSFSIARNYRFLAETTVPPPGVELVVLPGLDPGSLKPNDFGHSRQLIDRAYVMTGSFLDSKSREASGA
jgi:NTE family protein